MLKNEWKSKTNWRLGQVVPIGLGAIAVLNLLMSGVSLHSMNKITESIKLVSTSQTIKTDLRLLEKKIVDAETGQRGFLYTNDPNYLEPYNQSLKSLNNTFEDLKKIIVDPDQIDRLQIVEDLSEDKFAELAETIQLKKEGKEAEVKTLVTSNLGKQIMDEIRVTLKEMEDAENKIIEERQTIVTQAEQQATLISTGSALAIFLVICALIWFILRQVIKPIEQVSLGISSSASQIATTVEEQERIANQQAASVNQTTTTMDELGASSRQAASQAEAAAVNVEQLLMLSIGKNQTDYYISENRSNLKEKSEQIYHKVTNLSEKLTQINRISGVVSQLAAQTNILALNAAVEAVRAGEHGKGFGVISAEIRKLADQSAKNAEQINGLTAEIQNATDDTVTVTKEGTKIVEEMVLAINKTTLNIKQISLEANQQSKAIEQSVEAMISINQGAAENASGIAQVKISTEQLNQAAQILKYLI